MTQSDGPDRPLGRLPRDEPEAAPAPVDHASDPDPPVTPDPTAPERRAGPDEQRTTPGPSIPGPPETPPGPATPGRTAAGSGRPGRPSRDIRRAVISRLAVVLPAATGMLIVEGIFATRGQAGDVISLPAAVIALLLLWLGVAWALRSWVVLLMTFVPAIMITLGSAMVGDLAPGPGGALLLVGAALVATVIWLRLSAPARRWSPGWFGRAASTGAPWRAPGRQAGDWPSAPDDDWNDGVIAPHHGRRPPFGFRPLDPLGAHFLHPSAPQAPDDHPAADTDGDRLAPAWDTSATDVAARDRLVALLCRRGGTVGPSLASLEEFFTGNGDPRSIAPGLRGTVPLAAFRSVLHRIRAHPAVFQLLVQVEPLESGRYPAGEWPVAGSVHLVSALSAAEIDALAAELQPEATIGPLPADVLVDGTPAPPGSSEYAIWWG